MCVCVRACVCARARACTCAGACACAGAMRVQVCVHVNMRMVYIWGGYG